MSVELQYLDQVFDEVSVRATPTSQIESTNREVFTISRQLEFFTESELTKRLGYSADWWPAVLVAELIDNALDHCEEVGILPSIVIEVCASSIMVRDNGLGIPSEVVAAMTDFESRTSTRMGYACPTRGRQGNASKCLFAVPFVKNGSRGEVEINARGICHHITTTIDPIARKPTVEHRKESGKVQSGTSVMIDLPCSRSARGIDRIVPLVEEYAAFNSHAEFRLDFFGELFCWERTSGTIQKWTAKNPDPVHWYDSRFFTDRIADTIQLDRKRGQSRTVSMFIQQFAGLKRSDTRKTVLSSTGMAHCDLASFVNKSGVDVDKAVRLLVAMQKATEPPKPIKLGIIGREHIESSIGSKMKYKKVEGVTQHGLPFVVEAAFADRDDDSGWQLFTGINFSVDVRSPAVEGIYAWLADLKIDEDSPVDVLLHLTTPRVEFTNSGKTQVEICSLVKSAVKEALVTVTKQYTEKKKAEERDASRADRERQRRIQKPSKTSLRDAIFEVMEESIASVSQEGTCDFSARNHYYAVRPLVQQYTDSELTQQYLDRVIDEWEAENGIIERRTRDPRGFLLEPHTGKQIPLGTRQVDQYSIPLHLYHTIIYVEKKGLLSTFRFGEIAEKYDAAIICAEGYAVRAAQSLMQSASINHSMQVFVFHDADPAGYGIANAIGENSGAHKFKFEIIDAGLRLDEALEMNLPTETFTRSKSLARGLELTSNERRLFEGQRHDVTRKNGKRGNQWIGCQRVELNALAANPKLFVEWVESKLQQHGAAKKLIPSEKVFHDALATSYYKSRIDRIRDAVIEAVGIDRITKEIDKKLPVPTFDPEYKKILKWSKKHEPTSWTKVCDSRAEKILDRLNHDIKRAIANTTRTLRTKKAEGD